MSFVVCLLCACGLHSDPFGDVRGVERLRTTAWSPFCPRLCCDSPGVGCHSPSLDLVFGRLSRRGQWYSGWNANSISSEFGLQKSSLFPAPPLTPWAPPGEEMSLLLCWSQGGDLQWGAVLSSHIPPRPARPRDHRCLQGDAGNTLGGDQPWHVAFRAASMGKLCQLGQG